jgi:hypothetical protein
MAIQAIIIPVRVLLGYSNPIESAHCRATLVAMAQPSLLPGQSYPLPTQDDTKGKLYSIYIQAVIDNFTILGEM